MAVKIKYILVSNGDKHENKKMNMTVVLTMAFILISIPSAWLI